jgi:hypothetical protein
MDDRRIQVTDVESTSQESYKLRDGQECYLRRPSLGSIASWLLANSICTITPAGVIAGTVDHAGAPDVSIAAIMLLDVNIALLAVARLQELQNLLSYQFIETEKFLMSFQSGVLDHYGSSAFSFNGTVSPFLLVMSEDGTLPYCLP